MSTAAAIEMRQEEAEVITSEDGGEPDERSELVAIDSQ